MAEAECSCLLGGEDTVDEVLGTTSTATVDVSFADNTGTPHFVIVWSLLREGGRWKLDEQISSQRVA